MRKIAPFRRLKRLQNAYKFLSDSPFWATAVCPFSFFAAYPEGEIALGCQNLQTSLSSGGPGTDL
jgi:hypothetical protein